MEGELSALLAEARPDLSPAGPALGDALRQPLAATRARWPALTVPLAPFARRLATLLPDAASAAEAVASLHVGDLYLSCGCLLHLDAAVRILHDECLSGIPRFVAHLDRAPAFADEVRQEVGRKLLVGHPPAPPALTRYAGRAPLQNFVAVVAQRAGLDLLRKRGRGVRLEGDADLERRLAESPDPELEAVKRSMSGPFAEALAATIKALGARERMMLRLTLMSRLSLAQVGALCGVDASTVCRQLARTRARLALGLRRHLSTHHSIDATELESVVRLVQSRIDIDLAALLAPSGDALRP